MTTTAPTYVIREYKSDQPYLKLSSYEEAFDKCIEMYLKSDRKRTFYVSGVTVPRGKR